MRQISGWHEVHKRDCNFSSKFLRDVDEWYNIIQKFKLSAKDLENLFVDCLNPTPEELTLFEIEYGVPWITELKPEDLAKQV